MTETSTGISSSSSPSLSPIQHSFGALQINQTPSSEKSTNLDENIISIPIDEAQSNRSSLPLDDSLLKVCTPYK